MKEKLSKRNLPVEEDRESGLQHYIRLGDGTGI
jgi:hypothetical protein